MSAQVTEAHLELAKTVIFSRDASGRLLTAPMAAKLIAESEAKATAELRTVFPQICAALGNGAFCTPDVSVEFIKVIPNEVAEVVAQLRAEVERLRDGGVQRIKDAMAVVMDERDSLKARAERAEAELKKWSLLNLWGGTPEIIHAFVKGQQARIHATQDVEAELAAERARLDWLECHGWITGEPCDRAAIDAAMKEGA